MKVAVNAFVYVNPLVIVPAVIVKVAVYGNAFGNVGGHCGDNVGIYIIPTVIRGIIAACTCRRAFNDSVGCVACIAVFIIRNAKVVLVAPVIVVNGVNSVGIQIYTRKANIAAFLGA